jgi:tetratricopeptide (TPR) repeat protein
MNDRAGAVAAIDAAMERFPSGPNNEALAKLKQNLTETDPVKAALDRIDAAEVPELTKLLAKYEVYSTAPAADDEARNRNIETARGFLSQAAKLSPEDPKVVDALFEDAIRRGDKAEMTRLATLAESKNIDKVGGQFYRGRLQYVEEKFAEAAQSLRNVVERDKLNASAWRLLGATYLRLNNANSAAEAFGKAIEIRPNDVASVTAYLRSLIAGGRMSEALEQARKSERMAASNAEFADLYLRLEQSAPGGNPERALKARQAIAESRPDDKINLADLALLQMDQRRWDEAKATIDRLRGDEAFRDAVTELDARWFARQGKFAEAEKVFDDAIAARPKDKLDESIYIAASNILFEAGQPDRAVAMLKKGLPIQRKEFMVIDRQLGDLLFQSRRPLEAVEAYKRVLDAGSKDDGNAVAKRILEAYLIAKEYAKFDEMLASMGEVARTDATLLVLAAEAASEQGDLERASRLYDQAVAADQKNFVTFMKRGEFYAVHANRMRDALADFEQAARLAPNSVMPRRRLASLNMAMGKPEQAVEEANKALQIDPGDDALRNDLIELRLQLGQTDAVVDLVDQAITRKPDQIEWRLRGGQLMSLLGRIDRACDYLKPAWEMRKDMQVAIQYVTALVSRTPPDIRTATSVVQDASLKDADPMALHVLRALILHRDKRVANCDQEMAQALGKLDQNNPQRCELFMAGLETIYGSPKDQIAAFDRVQGRTELKGWMPVHKQMLRLRVPETAEAAAAELVKLADAAPDAGTRATIHQLLSQYYVGTQQYEKAVQYCRKVLEVDANNFAALNNAAFILAKHLKQPSDALPMAEKAVELVPNSPTALDTLGAVHLELKNCAKAEEYLKKAVDLSKSDNDAVPAMLHLAKALDCLERKADAQRLLERVRQRFERNPDLRTQFGEDLKQITQEIDGR